MTDPADRQAVHQIRQHEEAVWSQFLALKPPGLRAAVAWRWKWRRFYRTHRAVLAEADQLARDMDGDG